MGQRPCDQSTRGLSPAQGRARNDLDTAQRTARSVNIYRSVRLCGAVTLLFSTNSPCATECLGAGFTNRAGHASSIRILTQLDRMRLDRRSGLVATYRRPCVEIAFPEYFLQHHRAREWIEWPGRKSRCFRKVNCDLSQPVPRGCATLLLPLTMWPFAPNFRTENGGEGEIMWRCG